MSVRATNHVRRLGGLTPREKLVAFVLADHAHKVTGEIFPSMSTVAREAGLGPGSRAAASRIVQRLVKRGVLIPQKAVTRTQGKPTVYHINYAVKACDPVVTGQVSKTCDPVVTGRGQLIREASGLTCDPVAVEPVTLGAKTCDGAVTQRVFEREIQVRESSLMQFSQVQDNLEVHEPVPTVSQVEEALRKTAKRMSLSAANNGGQRAHLEAGIYRKKIENAFFDAKRAQMKPDECICEAIYAGALTLVGNRSVELRGLDHEDLARNVWERIRNSLAALHEMKNFDLQCRQVVAVVTRCLASVALEFWERERAQVSDTDTY
ncbi:MAG TPA: helix-turn-helix domain-containing protein [Verrucomicrobiae bacterium]|jgi:hypothetical protein|nr:helix-turn-helix domain-containing protein [Verrucomicrobiae bacterium]